MYIMMRSLSIVKYAILKKGSSVKKDILFILVIYSVNIFILKYLI